MKSRRRITGLRSNETKARTHVDGVRESRAELEKKLEARTRELNEALGQQTATSEVLGVISRSSGELTPVFQTILENAARLCEAQFGSLNLCEGDNLRAAATYHGMWTPDTARTEARRLLGLVASKIDPASERVRPAETFGGEVSRYLESKRTSLKNRTLTEVHRHLLVYAKPLHSLPLTKVDRRTVALRLSEIEQACGGVSRNRFRSSLSAFFAWAIREGLAENNPVTGTGKAHEGNGRDRVLTAAELTQLLKALGEDDFSDIIRLLLLTGSRRNEIGGLRWEEIDWAREMIVFPPERVKNGRVHELPLSRQAMAILERRRRGDGHVFGPFTTWSTSKEWLDRRLPGMKPYRLHDIRRSVATHLGELGILPHVIEQVLNHQSGSKAGIAGLYNRAKYLDPMRTALQAWGDYIDRLNPSD